MTFSRIKTPGWVVNDTLTSSDLNLLDTRFASALDKSPIGDTLSGAVTLQGGGRLIPSVAVGVNDNVPILVGSSNTVIQVTSSVTANRTWTLSATGASNGDTIAFFCDADFLYTIKILDQSGTTTLFELGNAQSNDGNWATFVYRAGWRVFQQRSQMRKQTFSTLSGSWLCPRGVNYVMLYGFGGGGAGGVGGIGDAGTNTAGIGGGGGGGALASWVMVDVTPGSTYSIVIGDGGVSNSTYNGGDTTFSLGGTTLARFVGATGGANGYTSSGSTLYKTTAGGFPGQYNPYAVTTDLVSKFSSQYYLLPHIGGNGGAPVDQYNSVATASSRGGSSVAGYLDLVYSGTAGVSQGGAGGANTSVYGGGGGGGAGPGGPGGNGGPGQGGGVTQGVSTTNEGAGGGGGGSAASGTGNSRLGGNGGRGGLMLYYWK